MKIIIYLLASFLTLSLADEHLKLYQNPTKFLRKLPKYPHCGADSESYRIYSNDVAKRGEHPWTAFIERNDKAVSICGGVLINPQFILTAKHCIGDETDSGDLRKNYHIQLGRWNRSSTGPECKPTVRKCDPFVPVKVREIKRHEKLDVALIKLTRGVKLTEIIKPICLPIFDSDQTVTFDESKIQNGTVFTVTGFGADSKDKIGTILKMKLNMKIIKISEDKFTATGNASRRFKTCSGDSGNAAVYNDTFIIGLLSSGNNLCDQEIDGTSDFVNIFALIPWIQKEVEGI